MHRYKEHGQLLPLKNGASSHGHLFNVELLPLEKLDAVVILRLQNQMAKVILTEMKYLLLRDGGYGNVPCFCTCSYCL